MLCYEDKAFCGSPNCENKCGRKITEEERKEAVAQHKMIVFAYFCDIPKEKIFTDVTPIYKHD